MENKKLKIIFFGTPKEVVPVLESLIVNFTVAAVVTTPDQKSSRKLLLTPSPVKAFAKQHNISVITPLQYDNETIKQLKILDPDLFVVAAYGKIIPDNILKLPEFGAINIHPSLLPKYRGPTPIQTALLNGDGAAGVTFIKMDKKIDHGPILHQLLFTLEKTDTFDWLMHSMFTQAAVIVPQVIKEYLAGKIKPQPQDENEATYTKIITKDDGYIDLSVLETLTPLEIENWKLKIARKIRAYYPWPAVWTKVRIRNQELRIKFLPNNLLQAEGKKPVSFKDFLNGYPEMKSLIEKIYTNP
jgi:methionyl-tRNA formyltransferase